jgi:hypothetical protein
MKTGKTYRGAEQIGEKERQRDNGLGRKRDWIRERERETMMVGRENSVG